MWLHFLLVVVLIFSVDTCKSYTSYINISQISLKSRPVEAGRDLSCSSRMLKSSSRNYLKMLYYRFNYCVDNSYQDTYRAFIFETQMGPVILFCSLIIEHILGPHCQSKDLICFLYKPTNLNTFQIFGWNTNLIFSYRGVHTHINFLDCSQTL